MSKADTFRHYLATLDVEGAMTMWARIAPHLPQPENAGQALIVMHHARTMAETVPVRMRCYSHAWLTERGLPSGLPDRLKRRAERLYPRQATAVGVAVKSLSGDHERAKTIEQAMSNAAAECYADGVIDPTVIKARMEAARRKIG